MKKSELKNNIAVKINGEIYLTSLSIGKFITKDGFMYLDDYDENLKYMGLEKEWDVSEYAIFDGYGGTNKVFDNGNSFLSWHKQEEETGDLTMSGEISIDCNWTENFNKQIEKEIIEGMKNNNEFVFRNTLGSFSTYIQDNNNFESLKPERIIYNKNLTICFWKDGTKIIVKTSKDERFVKEFGVAIAIMKKLYGSRNQFLKAVKSGKDMNQETIENGKISKNHKKKTGKK